MRTKISFFLLLAFYASSVYSQNKQIDSLETIIAKSNDTNTIRAALLLAKLYPPADSAKTHKALNVAQDLSIKLNYKKGITLAFCQKSQFLLNSHGPEVAINCLNGLIPYIDTVKANAEHSSYLIAMAGILANNGGLQEASSLYLKALKINDAINDKQGIAKSYHGLSFINTRMNNIDRSEYYGLKALAVYKELNDESGCIRINSNLGGVYLVRAFKTKSAADYTKAYTYLNESAESAMKTGQLETATVSYNNLAALFGSRENYSKALFYSRKALDIRIKTGHKYGIATTYNTMAQIFSAQKRYDSLEFYSFKSLALAKEINAPMIIKSVYEDLSILYENKKDPAKALSYYKLFKTVNDSLQNADKNKALAEAETKYESEKKDKEIGLLGELQIVKDKEISKQRIINYIIAGSLLLVIILSFFIFKQYAQKRKANNLLELQNKIINEKNRSITDSINYAKFIQDAILPNEKEFTSFFTDAFILFKPKDIVSGDFYWILPQHEKIFFAVADCTGHGVPGGFMSMLGTSLLNEIVTQSNSIQPGKILTVLRDKIMSSLRQHGEISESKDGMDATLCVLDKSKMTLNYACAYNNFFILRDGQLIESSYDKMPVGFHHELKDFETFSIDVKAGDSIYLFSDGYTDQFGGEKKKKFKVNQLKNLLLKIYNNPMPDQKKLLLQTIDQWQGNMEQTDDICLIGLKI